MKIISAEFLKSTLRPQDFPNDGRPEIAFAGRSNVGKSSLINALLNRRGLAKTSKSPGKTQTINFFDINGQFYFVDLPGYGYAEVPKSLQQEWGQAITSYLTHRRTLRLVVHLLDARHPPTKNDFRLTEVLRFANLPPCYVATKADKLTRNSLVQALATIRHELGLPDHATVIPFSAITSTGAKELWQAIGQRLGRG
ncbi:MAG: YihA family ribosome biogenesis GTP-binding protein [Candidatus Hydrogenedentes bacterium]|nr:YihA family ribosome biogenesis GTP-binding protein [Candidatus Hydrogenedentota bacterium]